MRSLRPVFWRAAGIVAVLVICILLAASDQGLPIRKLPLPTVVAARPTSKLELPPANPTRRATETPLARETVPSQPSKEATETPSERGVRPTSEAPETPSQPEQETPTPTIEGTPIPGAPMTPAPSPTPPVPPTPVPNPTPRPTAPTGRSFYVDSVNGSDSNSGSSPSAPWQSLRKISGFGFRPGDVLNLARGSSWTGDGGTSSTLVIDGAGAPGHPVIVQSYGTGSAPVLRNPSDSNSRALLVKGSWVVVQGLMLRDAHEAGVYLAPGADHGLVQSNEMTQVGAGVLVRSLYNLVTGNYVHDTTMINNGTEPDTNYGANGVLLQVSNNEVSYNRFINCRAPSNNYGTDGGAVELFGYVDNISVHHNYSNSSDGFIEAGGGSARNVLVAYNVIVNTGAAVGMHLSGKFAATVENFQFVNNTVVDTAGSYSLFFVEGKLSDSTLIVRNNIFYLMNYGVVMQTSDPQFTHDHNLYFFPGNTPVMNYGLGPGEKVADPGFVDVAGGDYRLRAGSPAISAGAGAAFALRDFSDQPLSDGLASDLGAFRHYGP